MRTDVAVSVIVFDTVAAVSIIAVGVDTCLIFSIFRVASFSFTTSTTTLIRRMVASNRSRGGSSLLALLLVFMLIVLVFFFKDFRSENFQFSD